MNSSTAQIDIEKSLFDGCMIQQYQQINAISHHLSNIERDEANSKCLKATMSWCSKCESKRDAQTMLHRDIMADENMCRIGASFLLRLSRPNDLNFQDDDNDNQHAPNHGDMISR